AAGTGIGLSLVEHFTRMHGGRVWVEERPGGGCRFQVELPGDVADAATGLEAGASGSSRSSSHAHAIAHH
ncbi:MAG: histidine kinase, partial [Thermoleophilia bacterium]|nr:histidine kinase [Thermoleophilia bacterium]